MAFGWINPGTLNDVPSSKIELSVRCENIADTDMVSKSDPVCILYINTTKEEATGSWEEVGRTERIMETLSPTWQKKFSLEYRFEEKQKLRFSIYDWDGESERLVEHDFLGSMECNLGEVVAAARFRGYQSRLVGKGGQIFVHAEVMSGNKEVATMKFSAKNLDDKDFFSKSDPFFEISKVDESNQFTVVYRSETVDNNLNPNWKEFNINVCSLCNGDYDRGLKIDIFDFDDDGSHDIIGTIHTNLRNLRKGNVFECIKENKNKISGTFILDHISIEEHHSFLNYLKGGTQINMNLAIDFTSSNGTPSDPSSLHYRDPTGKPNQYVTAIQAVGEIIQQYDLDKQFACLGFGARLTKEEEVNHAFFLSLDGKNAFCSGLDGIISTYYTALQKIHLYGPTHFSPVIMHFTDLMRYNMTENENHQRNYCVLLIISDGLILDFEDTKKAIIEAAELPISIIIVGVGDEDFTAMEALDSDKIVLESEGINAARDIVQFVEMRKFVQPGYGWDKKQLAKAVLAEIPNQLVNYMKSHGYKPIS